MRYFDEISNDMSAAIEYAKYRRRWGVRLRLVPAWLTEDAAGCYAVFRREGLEHWAAVVRTWDASGVIAGEEEEEPEHGSFWVMVGLQVLFKLLELWWERRERIRK